MPLEVTFPTLCWGIAGRLRQVLLNLVGNAIKFTEHGEVVVHVDKIAGDGEAGLSGLRASRIPASAFPQEKQAMIFEVFTQAMVQPPGNLVAPDSAWPFRNGLSS